MENIKRVVLVARDLPQWIKNHIGCETKGTIACHGRVNAGVLCIDSTIISQDSIRAKQLVHVENEFSNWSLLRINVSSKYRIIVLHYFLSGLVMIESTKDNRTFRVYRIGIGTLNKTATWISTINSIYRRGVIVTGDLFMLSEHKEVRGSIVKYHKVLKGSK